MIRLMIRDVRKMRSLSCALIFVSFIIIVQLKINIYLPDPSTCVIVESVKGRSINYYVCYWQSYVAGQR